MKDYLVKEVKTSACFNIIDMHFIIADESVINE
jgi:hypothetical protein